MQRTAKQIAKHNAKSPKKGTAAYEKMMADVAFMHRMTEQAVDARAELDAELRRERRAAQRKKGGRHGA